MTKVNQNIEQSIRIFLAYHLGDCTEENDSPEYGQQFCDISFDKEGWCIDSLGVLIGDKIEIEIPKSEYKFQTPLCKLISKRVGDIMETVIENHYESQLEAKQFA